MKPLALLFLSTPVGPLGSGLGGGVELTVINLARAMVALGHRVTIVSPAAVKAAPLRFENLEHSAIDIVQVPGTWQVTAQTQQRDCPVTVGTALANAWEYARQTQARYDLLVNFAYDWLPYYLTPFLMRPVAHFVSMGSLSDRMDTVIAQVVAQFPGTVGAYTQAQVQTFKGLLEDSSEGVFQTPASQWKILGSAVDIAQYSYCQQPDNFVAWVGRISPEKGLEDAIAATQAADIPLKIFGKLENPTYWEKCQQQIDRAATNISVEYVGFLSTADLQRQLRRARALLMTPQWTEAFGIVAIEALACGVPVIAYRCGGPAEIVRSGQTGWLVEPGNIGQLVDAITKVDSIDRWACRQQAETHYALPAWGERFERWFYNVVSGVVSSSGASGSM
ncbi:MAG: glycosyltransferase [Cyanobacteria bacterium J06623_4]